MENICVGDLFYRASEFNDDRTEGNFLDPPMELGFT